MHKGYTLSYFINFFSNTTNTQFRTNTATEIAGTPGRALALRNFIGNINSVAAGTGSYSSLGATPRTRVLRALRNRKRTGSVLN